MSETIFQDAEATADSIRWRAPSSGRGWSPLPDAGGGPLTEEDLYLWRFVWELRPEAGHFFFVVEDHPTQRQYIGKEELPFVEVSATWAQGDPPSQDGPAGLLVKLTRFGQAVEFLTFAGRDETGAGGNVFVTADDESANAFADGGAKEPGTHCLAWGGVQTPGPGTPAGLWLERGVGDLDLAAALSGLGERLASDASTWAAGDRLAQRKLLMQLIQD